MDRKGMELAISTIVIIILGLSVLIGLILMATKGFGFWREGTEPILRSGSIATIRQACDISCTAGDSNTFCCSSFELDDMEVYCTNGTIGVSCSSIDCSRASCS